MNGFFVGAQNSNQFKALLHSDVQIIDSNITYQGCFNEHFYDLGKPEQSKLVVLQNYSAIVTNPLTQNKEIFVASFFKSCLDGRPRGNQPIDIVVILDVSGSMSCPVTNSSNREKIDLAKSTIVQLYEKSLRSDDRFGLGTFDDAGYQLIQLQNRSDISSEQLHSIIDKIKVGGGTTLEAGLGCGIDLFKQHNQNQQSQQISEQIPREKRIVMITDMEDMGSNLGAMIQQCAKDQIHVSVIGVGISFNSTLAEQIMKVEGSNYFSITQDDEMKEIIVDQFHYNFFPCAYNALVRIESDDYTVIRTYGTPIDDTYVEPSYDVIKQVEINKFQDVQGSQQSQQSEQSQSQSQAQTDKHDKLPLQKSQCITEINTLSPSAIENGKVKGGLLLIRLKPNGQQTGKLRLILTYKDMTKTKSFEDVYEINIDKSIDEDYYENMTIKKGIMLFRYVDVIKDTVKVNKELVKQEAMKKKQSEKLQTIMDLLKSNSEELSELKQIHEQLSKFAKKVSDIKIQNDKIEDDDSQERLEYLIQQLKQ